MPQRRSRTWLAALAREVAVIARPSSATSGTRLACEAWLVEALEARGFLLGLPLDALAPLSERTDDADYEEYALLNNVAHQLHLAFGLRRRAGLAADSMRDPLWAMMVTAWFLDDEVLAERAYELLDNAPSEGSRRNRRFARAANGLAAKLGDALVQRALGSHHPLLGHPFHQVLLYQDALLFGRIAREALEAMARPGGRLEARDVMWAHGAAHLALLQTISASVALCAVDKEITTEERRFVDLLAEAARLTDTETDMVRAELLQPLSAQAIAQETTDPYLRDFILRILFLAAHVDGHFADAERAFVDEIAVAFGISEATLARFELEAIANYEQHATLIEKLSLTGLVRRMRQHATSQLEKVVSQNAAALWGELKETSQLGELLLKAQVKDLTDEEKALVKAQVLDLCKAVPALAIFAVPGGGILVALAIKHLPFKVLPSNFNAPEDF